MVSARNPRPAMESPRPPKATDPRSVAGRAKEGVNFIQKLFVKPQVADEDEGEFVDRISEIVAAKGNKPSPYWRPLENPPQARIEYRLMRPRTKFMEESHPCSPLVNARHRGQSNVQISGRHMSFSELQDPFHDPSANDLMYMKVLRLREATVSLVSDPQYLGDWGFYIKDYSEVCQIGPSSPQFYFFTYVDGYHFTLWC
jgi:hypothetical protein